MKPYIKQLWVSWTQQPIEEWAPEKNHLVNYWLEIEIGYEGEAGTDDCKVVVLTEDSKRHFNLKRTPPKRCIVVAGEYQWLKVEHLVKKAFDSCASADFQKFRSDIGKLFRLDDY